MRLVQLAEGCFTVPARWRDIEVCGLTCDSREVKPGYLFVALAGCRTDGHLYARMAEEAGAVAIVGERTRVPRKPNGQVAAGPLRIPVFRVDDSRRALGRLARNYFGEERRPLELVGVTGTKGKTTTTWLVDAIFRNAGKVSALFGTVLNRVGETVYPSNNTTPSCMQLHRFLDQLAGRGGTHAVLEVSSHGILQRRTEGLDFRAGIFTNVAPEHLDYHKTFASYVETKVSFFTELSPSSFAILPREEPTSMTIAARTPARVVWYGTEIQDGVDRVRIEPEGMSFRWRGLPVHTRLWGYHNLLNILGAMTCAECLGFTREEIVHGIEAAEAPPGRLEEILHGGGFRVFVDYAHTDGSLETVLRALRPMTRGRIITVFGCGGDRDRTKRPRMGRVAEKWSDNIVVTSDNPRTEDPEAIIKNIVAGLDHPEEAVFVVDRREAIALGIRMARENDTVLIAGKGHETYQEIKDRRIHFDDREVAREFLSETIHMGS